MTSSISINAQPALKVKPISFGKNNTFDVLFILSGGIALFLPLVWYVGEAKMAQHIPLDWLWWGNQIVSMPHVWATYVRLNRKIGENKVSPLVGWPSIAAILALSIFSMVNHFWAYVWTAINVWQSYHYLRQGYGISRFFGRTESETVTERMLSNWAYHLAMPLFILGRWHYLYIAWSGKTEQDIIPVQFPTFFITSLWIIAGVALCMGLASEVLKYRRSTTYNASGLVALLVYFGMHWYGFLSLDYWVSGFTAVTVFHAVQYLAIIWRLEEKQTSSKFLQTRLLHLVPLSLSFLAFGGLVYLVGDFMQTKVFTLGDY
ncbi:MAG TPA: hypothetical protein V6C72_01135, partial [Chroococcales cyanobacterium]